jgi:hypothetical protein
VRELEILSVAAWASGREISVGGKHRTEVTEATEGIWGGWPKFYRWQRRRLGEKSGATEKHRTEVTEATEGDLGWVAKIYRWQRGRLGGEIRCNRKASHRGHRGHRGGIGVGGQNLSVAAWAFGRGNQVQQKSIAQRSQRGDWGGWPKFYRRQPGRRARNQVQGESIALRSWREIGLGGQRFYQQQRGRPGENCKRNGQSIVESCSGTRSMRKCKSPHRKERQPGA